MAHRYELKVVIDETGENISLSGEFEESEYLLLEEFVRYSDDILETKFIQSGDAGELTIKFEQAERRLMTVATRLPDWNDVMAFLHRFRPILLQNDRTNFYTIHNILAKKFGHPRLREFLGHCHFIYSGKRQRSGIQFRTNDVLINSEKLLSDWLNSHEYHKDSEKQRFIEELHRVMPLDVSKVLFLGLLIDKAQAVCELSNLIRVALGQQNSMTLKMWQKPIGLNVSKNG
ncbi:MAG TPA: hypothetical protein VFU37_18450 [Pyrinomonadaceae bacterium]|nr:hypothetical protein [Pyrinomonadaceae bacterium]